MNNFNKSKKLQLKYNYTVCYYKDGCLPIRQTKYSIGYDLYASNDCVIKPYQRYSVDVGCKFDFYINNKTGDVHYALIVGRSSLNKIGIIVSYGLIDPDYKNELCACIYNQNNDEFIIKAGDRIAQLILCEYNLHRTLIQDPNGLLVNSKDITRISGFGSTGKR